MIAASSNQMAHGEPVDAISLLSLPAVSANFPDKIGEGVFEQPVKLENVVWHRGDKGVIGEDIVIRGFTAMKDDGP